MSVLLVMYDNLIFWGKLLGVGVVVLYCVISFIYAVYLDSEGYTSEDSFKVLGKFKKILFILLFVALGCFILPTIDSIKSMESKIGNSFSGHESISNKIE